MMRNLAVAGILLGMLTLVVVAADENNSVVITFKDGHKQTFPLSEVTRIQLKTPKETTNVPLPLTSLTASVGHFLGRWRAGDGTGRTFIITLKRDGSATKSIGATHGTWKVE